MDGRPKNFAALYAVKLNAFDIHKGGEGSQIAYAIIPEQKDIKWYLPASEQFSGSAGLNGQYWSSTAINDNTDAIHGMVHRKVRQEWICIKSVPSVKSPKIHP